jgi:CubicO group peptidase (beta-lactamase class C family)
MKHHFRAILATTLLITDSVIATAWVARTTMSSADFQAEINRWRAEPYQLRPVCISGYETPLGTRYAAVWERPASTLWIESHGLTDTQLHNVTDFYAAYHYLPVFVSGFIAGGVRYYNALWEYRPAGDSVVVLGASQNTLDTLTIVRKQQGYTFNHVSTFTEDDLPRYNAIWTRGTVELTNEFAVRYGLTSAQYQNAFNALTGAGYRLTAQTVSFDGGSERMAAVFRKPFGVAWWSVSGITGANYEGETWNAYYQGYRPSFVSVHNRNGELRFNAVWTHNGGMTPNQTGPAEELIRYYMVINKIAGLSVAVSRNGRLIYAKGFGFADRQAGEWMNPHHRLRIGSVSKTITAAGVLHQRQTELLNSLDRKVFGPGPGAVLGHRFGVLPYSANEQLVTVRHLLNHTSGWTDNPEYDANREAHIGNFLDDFDVTNTPGTTYRYFNDDYVILGRVIEQLSGKTYQQYMQDAVLAPCGVTDMEIGGRTRAERKPREVVYHSTNGDTYYRDLEHGDSTGGWIAKPMDMLLLLRRMDNNAANTDFISQELFNQMQTDSVAAQGYGLGVMLRPGPGWWGHDGGLEGTMAFLRQYNDGFAIAMVCNEDEGPFGLLVDDVANVFRAIPPGDLPDYDLFPGANPAFDDWTADKFPFPLSSHPGLKEEIWGPEANPDRDELTNALEAAFGGNPLVWNPVPYNSSRIGNDLVLRWRRAVPLISYGAQLETQVAHTLRTGPQIWLPGPPVQTASGVINPVGFTTLETRLSMGNDPRTFLRFRAITP